MKSIALRMSDEEYKRFSDLLSKMKSKKAFIEDILIHYEHLYEVGNLNHFVKKKYHVPDEDNYE